MRLKLHNILKIENADIEKGIEKDVKYYMAEDSDETKLSTLKEVTNDLNRVFTRLAAPLREIMNVDVVRNSMK